jgi:hypothetical protein
MGGKMLSIILGVIVLAVMIFHYYVFFILKAKIKYGWYWVCIYHERFVNPNRAGTAWGPVIGIVPGRLSDVGILEHEKCHSRQWWKKLGLFHWLYYKYSNDYRFASEFEAYTVQLKHPPATKDPTRYALLYAYFIIATYDLPDRYGNQREVANMLLEASGDV